MPEEIDAWKERVKGMSYQPGVFRIHSSDSQLIDRAVCLCDVESVCFPFAVGSNGKQVRSIFSHLVLFIQLYQFFDGP